MKTYTLNQIKGAFWAEFHLSGERWFNYLGSEKDNEEYTQGAWENFVEELNKIPEEGEHGNHS